jgi:GH15 family glucan-1,4-alpha-glucosidase
MTTTPIADYALLSDRHSTALVSRAGSIDWLCFPRFDSPTVLARLLDDDAGHWSIRPAGRFQATRRYLDRTMVLETTFRTGTGTVVLTEAMALGEGNGGHRLGVGVPHLLVRRISCVAGEVPIEIDFCPRPEYGLIRPILSPVDGGITARGGADWLVLTTPVPLDAPRAGGGAGGARGEAVLREGTTLHLALQRSTVGEPPARVWTAGDLAARLDETVAAWRSWSALHQNYTGPWAELVHHGGRVLQALSYQPTGAIVAAPTTSLPELVGGERNWDYRFTWVRDASLTMEALWVAACPDEANDFFAFLTTAAPTLPEDRALQIMFGVTGRHDLTERTMPHLRGWRGSRPVRVGNGAWSQRQIDVYGELLSAAHLLSAQLTGMDADTRRFLVSCADAAAERWREKDQGIWEVRGEPRHFLHSKIMCWTALDRAVKMADRLGAGDREPAWRRVRDEIHSTVVEYGWNPDAAEAGAFTQAFDSTESAPTRWRRAGRPTLDAAALIVPVVGLLPATDPRVLATIDAIERHLTDERGLVYRYRAETGVDGLAGGEGTFLLCTFWLAHGLALSGQVDRAAEVFERAAGHANDVGLLAEQVDPANGELLGNFPQAFSHIGLVTAAYAISQADSAL